MTFITRFAPSPTGPLHLGHAYSALLAHDIARAVGGQFLLRIEDIDRSRARPQWERQIYEDLSWLGITWDTQATRQSDHMARYQAALQTLWDRDLLYPCSCNRRDIQQAASAPQEGAPMFGPDGLIYPGTCRDNYTSTQSPMPHDCALRLNITAAAAQNGVLKSSKNFSSENNPTAIFQECGNGDLTPKGTITFTLPELQSEIGDVVLSRRDMGTSYHLSVVLDDAAQGINDVVRGEDLFEATRIHVLLQKLLDLPTPRYHHHNLIRDDTGKRLAKRDDARAISKYRAEGASPADIRAMVGL